MKKESVTEDIQTKAFSWSEPLSYEVSIPITSPILGDIKCDPYDHDSVAVRIDSIAGSNNSNQSKISESEARVTESEAIESWMNNSKDMIETDEYISIKKYLFSTFERIDQNQKSMKKEIFWVMFGELLLIILMWSMFLAISPISK